MPGSVQAKGINDVINKEFDDNFLWILEKNGKHTPDTATVRFIIRQYLLKRDPGMSSDQIEKHFNQHNIAIVWKLLEKFYKDRGILAVKSKKVSRSASRGTKAPRKAKKVSRSSSRETKSPKNAKKTKSRRKSSKESRGKGKDKSISRRSKDKSSRSRK